MNEQQQDRVWHLEDDLRRERDRTAAANETAQQFKRWYGEAVEKANDFEAQLRQEREAKDAAYKEIDRLGDILRSENRLANKSGWDQLRTEIAQLQTAISQLRAQMPDRGETLGTIIYDPVKGTVEYEQANITQKPEEEAKP